MRARTWLTEQAKNPSVAPSRPRFEQRRAWYRVAILVLIGIVVGARRSPAALPCIGDCRHIGRVGITDVIVGVDILLERRPATDCQAFANANGTVDVAQLVSGIDNALHGCPLTQVKRIALPANDLLYDRFRDTIYASVPSRAGSNGNSIVPINPHTGAVGASVFVGSEPGALAISDDGQYLYVAIEGAASVRRVALASMTPEIEFQLGVGRLSRFRYAGQLLVVPGDPHAVVVSLRNRGLSPSFAGVAVFDDGVQRPNEASDDSGADALAFSDSASVLYGLNTEDTGANFVVMNLDGSGISVSSESGGYNGPFTAFGSGIRFDDGLLYASSGEAYDPVAARLVGRFQKFGFVVPDSANRRVFFLSDEYNGKLSISVFDQDTFLPVATIKIPNPDYTLEPHSFLRWGADGLAFAQSQGFPNAGGDTIVIVETSLGFP